MSVEGAELFEKRVEMEKHLKERRTKAEERRASDAVTSDVVWMAVS